LKVEIIYHRWVYLRFYFGFLPQSLHEYLGQQKETLYHLVEQKPVGYVAQESFEVRDGVFAVRWSLGRSRAGVTGEQIQPLWVLRIEESSARLR